MKKFAILLLLAIPCWGAPPEHPDFAKVNDPVVTSALKSSESLWSTMTEPKTSLLHRRAAAAQGAHLYRSILPRLVRALGQLQKERAIHDWGLLPAPMESRPYFQRPPDADPTRQILGHKWTRPTKALPYPQTWDQQQQAPWPWQVEQTLQAYYGLLAPHDAKAAEPWLQECMKLPLDTDQQAEEFLGAVRLSSHWSSLAILKRFYKVSLDPKMPVAAAQVAQSIGQISRLWDHPDSVWLCQVIALDILKSSPHQEARSRAAYEVKQFRERWRYSNPVELPEPSSCIEQLLSMAEDPKNGDAWNRLYNYGFSACEAMKTSPIQIDRRMDPSSPLVKQRLQELAAWHKAHRAELKLATEKQRSSLDKARQSLKAP